MPKVPRPLTKSPSLLGVLAASVPPVPNRAGKPELGRAEAIRGRGARSSTGVNDSPPRLAPWAPRRSDASRIPRFFVCKVAVFTATEARGAKVAAAPLPFIVNVTDLAPGSGSALDAVTVLKPRADPRVRVVLDVAALFGPLVGLGWGEKLSPDALLVQLTVPQGGGITIPSELQSIDTTKGLATAVLLEAL